MSKLLRVIAAIAILFTNLRGVYAEGWSYRVYSPGYYTYSNGVTNDGYYYTYYCGKYARYSAIPQTTNITNVTYTNDWKNNLVKALDRAKDNEFFIKSVQASGLSISDNSPLLQASYGQYGYAVKGQTVYQQGSTVYGIQAYAPDIGRVSIDANLERMSRLAGRLGESTQFANAAFADRLGQVAEAQKEIAKVQEAGRVMVAAISASQTPKTITQTFQAEPAYPSPSRSNGRYQPPSDPRNDNAQSGITTGSDDSGRTIAVVRTQALYNVACNECHSGPKPKGNLDLTNVTRWGLEQHRAYDYKIRDRVTTDDPEKVMPPSDSKHKRLTGDELRSILAAHPEDGPNAEREPS